MYNIPFDKEYEDALIETAKTLPVDDALKLIRDYGCKMSKGKITNFFSELVERHPELRTILLSNVKITKTDSIDSREK